MGGGKYIASEHQEQGETPMLFLRVFMVEMEDELPAASGCVNALLNTTKSDTLSLKLGDRLDEVFERAAQAVEPPDNEGIAAPDEVQGLVQSWPVRFGATGGTGKDALTADCLKSILLEGKGLFLRGDTGIANEHSGAQVA